MLTNLQLANPFSKQVGAGVNPVALSGKLGDLLVSNLRGVYANANEYGAVFSASAAAVTVPVVANNLVSVFGLYNPPNSGVNLEIIDTFVGTVSATTVVDVFGWYASTVQKSASATFTTPGVVGTNVFCRKIGSTAGPAGQFYSAVTHSGTPTLVATIGAMGAVTNADSTMPYKAFNGALILTPGTLMSVATSTAAGTATGLLVEAAWLETPAT